jgi:hypothetical protein
MDAGRARERRSHTEVSRTRQRCRAWSKYTCISDREEMRRERRRAHTEVVEAADRTCSRVHVIALHLELGDAPTTKLAYLAAEGRPGSTKI